MEVKINSRLFFMGTICVLVTALVTSLFFRTAFYNQAEENIRSITETVAEAYNNGADLSAFSGKGYRLTLIAANGTILYDTDVPSETMDDHSTREEVIEALSDGSALSTRHSSTMGADTYYCAVRLSDGNILRTAQEVKTVWHLYNTTLYIVFIAAIAALLLSIIFSVMLTKQLVDPINRLGAPLDDPASKVPYPELEPFVASLREYQRRERQHERQRQEFTANVSHELKTPLTSISGYAEMLEYGMCRPEDVSSFGARIHSEASRLITLVGDIIKLSKLDTADSTPTFEKLDLNEIAEHTADLLMLNAEKAGITLAVRGSEAYVMGSRKILDEMIYNLCDNAIRYNKPGGHVWLTTGSDDGKTVYIEVRDDGIGIPLEHQSRIFERFYRVDKSHSKETGGTGLGLAIVKHSAALHEGRISLESKEGVGTAIRVTMPLCR